MQLLKRCLLVNCSNNRHLKHRHAGMVDTHELGSCWSFFQPADRPFAPGACHGGPKGDSKGVGQEGVVDKGGVEREVCGD